jgi:hypothetical protein
VGWNRVLLLGWLHLRRGRARLLLLLGRDGLACDESPDPSESLDVLRRSPQPVEGWTAKADGLAGSDVSGGIDA